MRLRSFLLLAVVVAGASVVALEFSARSAARDMADALEPLATLSYESAGIAVDGSVRLREPRLTIKRGIWKGNVLARVADLRGGGPLWLVMHAIGSGPRLPAQMRVRARGLQLGDSASTVPLAGWFGTTDLALFENLGCGSDALSDKDRLRMGIVTSERNDEFRYQFDPAARSLALSMDLHSESIAAIHATAQLSGVGDSAWQEPAAFSKIRVARASVGYQDAGYFVRRNQFCAQWLGVSAAQFIEKHLEAVQAFLGVRGIIPGKEVLSLYRQLATRGGSLNLTSLPGSSWVPAEIEAYPREDLLRFLNVTARLEDAPPIMLRLAFSAPESPAGITSVVDPPVATPSQSVGSAGIAPPGDGSREGTGEVAVALTKRVQTTPPVSPLFSEPVATTVGLPTAETSAAMASATKMPVPDTGGQSPERRIVASAPPPPKDSTLALVWKPGVIERLPRQSANGTEYLVVAKERLPGTIGTRVQLLTENGKWVEGEVIRVSVDAVVLSLVMSRGNAEISVPLAGIREVRQRARDGVSP